MTILSGEEIKNRGLVDPPSQRDVEPAAYNLSLGTFYLHVDGEEYKKGVKPYCEPSITLPARRVSVLSTNEKIILPKNLCAKVGITFSLAKKGLIALFGPMIDPGYNDHFIAVVYNVTNRSITIPIGEKFLKMEIHTVFKASTAKESYAEMGPFDPEFTEKDSVGDLTESVSEAKRKLSRLDEQINAVVGGYKSLLLFGVFLVAASILGAVLSFLLLSLQQINLDDLIGVPHVQLGAVVFLAILAGGAITIAVMTIRHIAKRDDGG